MRSAYVLTESHFDGRHHERLTERKKLHVVGPPEALCLGLRPWALEVITGEHFDDGRYCAFLVELDEDGTFDTYLSLCAEEVFWFYEKEYIASDH